jgi:hypothetical protein
MQFWWRAAVFTIAALLLPVPALADGEIRADYTGGAEKVYPGLKLHVTPEAVYFVDVDAHQMLVLLKTKCVRDGALQMCTGTQVTWDRYGVRTDLDATQVTYYYNGSQNSVGIKNTPYTLTPNTLKVDIVTNKGTHVMGIGYVDSTETP